MCCFFFITEQIPSLEAFIIIYMYANPLTYFFMKFNNWATLKSWNLNHNLISKWSSPVVSAYLLQATRPKQKVHIYHTQSSQRINIVSFINKCRFLLLWLPFSVGVWSSLVYQLLPIFFPHSQESSRTEIKTNNGTTTKTHTNLRFFSSYQCVCNEVTFPAQENNECL